MDEVQNPFSPGAGCPPPELAGRGEVLRQADLAIRRLRTGKSPQGPILTGLRGVGKTVLLLEIQKRAEKSGCLTLRIEAQEKADIKKILMPPLRSALIKLSTRAKVNESVRRALRVAKSFLSGVKFTYQEAGVEIEPEPGVGDSGNLDADLADMFVATAQAAGSCKTAVVILIDELQYLAENEINALIMAVHRMSQESLPLFVIGAGLPQLTGTMGRAKSYAERSFRYFEVGTLDLDDTRKALQEPAEAAGAKFTSDALDEIYKRTQGYPYFIQEWGYHAWNIAPSKMIGVDTIARASRAATKSLDKSFFRVRFDRLTPREKVYLRALAELGVETDRSGNVAKILGTSSQREAPVRGSLILKGMVYSPQYGSTAFTVPLFGDFMKRAMPDWTPSP
jgi:hypothetical protein